MSKRIPNRYTAYGLSNICTLEYSLLCPLFSAPVNRLYNNNFIYIKINRKKGVIFIRIIPVDLVNC